MKYIQKFYGFDDSPELKSLKKDSSGSISDNLEIRAVYTSDNKDSHGDIIEREATVKALDEYRNWRNIRYMHQPKAVGVAKHIGEGDGAEGLKWNEAIINLVDKDTINQVQNDVLKGLSVGILFNPFDEEAVEIMEGGGWRIKEYMLAEISVVDHPANPEASIIERAIKSVGEGLNFDLGSQEAQVAIREAETPGQTAKVLKHLASTNIVKSEEENPMKNLDETTKDIPEEELDAEETPVEELEEENTEEEVPVEEDEIEEPVEEEVEDAPEEEAVDKETPSDEEAPEEEEESPEEEDEPSEDEEEVPSEDESEEEEVPSEEEDEEEMPDASEKEETPESEEAEEAPAEEEDVPDVSEQEEVPSEDVETTEQPSESNESEEKTITDNEEDITISELAEQVKALTDLVKSMAEAPEAETREADEVTPSADEESEEETQESPANRKDNVEVSEEQEEEKGAWNNRKYTKSFLRIRDALRNE